MSAGTPFQPHQLCISKSNACSHQPKLFEVHGRSHFLNITLSSCASRQDQWTKSVSCQINRPLFHMPYRYNAFICQSFALPGGDIYPILKSTVLSLSSSVNALCGSPLLLKLFPAFGAIGFAIWGLEPLIRHSRSFFFHRNDASWKKSATYYVSMSYLKPLFLWSGAMVACRVLDPVVLTSEASQIVKQRLLHFVKSLSTVLAFAYCLSSLIEQMQKFVLYTNVNSNDARNMGFQFAGKAVYTAIWVAAVSLFMELLGFSTQKWLTAGGLGTVLLTLAGREIFTNFLSSIMIHATRPFVVNEWIQTKIEGYDVSGTVEHVGWWSPTIIRGEDREAIHIPNHKFTMNVVRNLTQKTHWRIKTHLAISHLDANKISNIVADMRKVMSKNPQVEQQRLHRRVFLEYINPENQAFMILISCFIKTSHFEEYLCVKEAILLDLLRVISHHRARLATPIRTVQKMYGDVDLENVPFADTIFTHGRAPIRNPLYLIDSTARINGEDKPKSRSSTFASEEHLKSTSASDKRSTNLASDGPLSDKKRNQKMTSSGDSSLVSEDPLSNNLEDNQTGKKSKTDNAQTKSTAPDRVKTMSTSSPKTQVEGSDGKDANSVKSTVKSLDSTQLNMSNGKESEKSPSIQQPTKKSSLEENIVLGVALDGAKRTLPIDEGIDSPPLEPTKEFAALAKGNGSAVSTKDKKDGSASMVADEKSTDVQDQDRG